MKIETVEALREIYGMPGKGSLVKEVPDVIYPYARYIEASPFCTLATIGPSGMDCSPRGDKPGFVEIEGTRTLLMPDRRGNNRVDSLENIVRDPRVALCFMVPGSLNCLRVNGEAEVRTDPALLEKFSEEGKLPRSVIRIHTQAVYFQCGRALIRSKLWEADAKINPDTLPTAGDVLDLVTKGDIDGKSYDAEWPERARQSLW